ncbi:MAG: SprT-like domain-containing protein, partial [Myxococcales bacterium]|nr:SprT-like domain-containing protein [Myxococcales bacterium]
MIIEDRESPTPAALSAALEAALLRVLRQRYDWENRERFANRLTPPVLVLSDSTTHLGRWHSATRILEISRPLLLDRPWLEVTSVLDHEMAHQYVDEFLRVHNEPPHGETFRRVCAERGIDARAAGA